MATVPTWPSVAQRKQVPAPTAVRLAEFPLGTIEARPLSQSSAQVTGVSVPVTWATTLTFSPSPRRYDCSSRATVTPGGGGGGGDGCDGGGGVSSAPHATRNDAAPTRNNNLPSCIIGTTLVTAAGNVLELLFFMIASSNLVRD
jgi:hypothetical protein